MQTIVKYYREIIITILALFLAFNLCDITVLRKQKSALEDLNALQEQTFKVEKNKLQETLASQEVVITQNKEVVQSLIKDLDFAKHNVKKATIVIKEVTTTEIKDKFIYFTDTVRSPWDTSFVSVPKAFKDSTNFYVVSGVVKLKGIQLDKVSFPLTTTHVIYTKRKNIFQKTSVLVTNYSNPYVTINKKQSIILKKEPSLLTKILCNALVLGTGVYIGTKF